jgi:hypothetical protein
MLARSLVDSGSDVSAAREHARDRAFSGRSLDPSSLRRPCPRLGRPNGGRLPRPPLVECAGATPRPNRDSCTRRRVGRKKLKSHRPQHREFTAPSRSRDSCMHSPLTAPKRSSGGPGPDRCSALKPVDFRSPRNLFRCSLVVQEDGSGCPVPAKDPRKAGYLLPKVSVLLLSDAVRVRCNMYSHVCILTRW